MPENYNQNALSDARDMIDNFADAIAEQARDDKVSDDLFDDYLDGDDYHHTNHVDKEYSLSEADGILEQLSEDEETDTGLWEGLAPREAISAQAAYTYGNAVLRRWQSYIGELNELLDDVIGEDRREGFARLWILLVCNHKADNPESGPDGAMAYNALDRLSAGELDGVGIYADWLDEHEDKRATALRAAMAIEPTN